MIRRHDGRRTQLADIACMRPVEAVYSQAMHAALQHHHCHYRCMYTIYLNYSFKVVDTNMKCILMTNIFVIE